jgi:aminopeptidase N
MQHRLKRFLQFLTLSMAKWIACIAILFSIFAPLLSSAKIKNPGFYNVSDKLQISLLRNNDVLKDTTTKKSKKQQDDDKKIKELAKAKHQPKPEKIEPVDDSKSKKARRQRRPQGLETPPEIPRRSGN